MPEDHLLGLVHSVFLQSHSHRQSPFSEAAHTPVTTNFPNPLNHLPPSPCNRMLSSDRMRHPSYEASPLSAALHKRATANRANAQLSTGPKTEAGKAAIALNNLRHGLAGAFLILPTENQEDFDALLEGLLDEHQPATETERLLITNMARHQWLSNRAINLQRLTFGNHGVCESGDRLLLYMRYQTTHQRAFHKCLNDLLKLRAERRKTEIGFERQAHAIAAEERKHSSEIRKQADESRKQAAEVRKQQLHESRLNLITVQIAAKTARPPAPPIPEHPPAERKIAA